LHVVFFFYTLFYTVDTGMLHQILGQQILKTEKNIVKPAHVGISINQ